MVGICEGIDAGPRGLEVEYSPPWASVLDDGKEIMGPSSSDISDCEVMMVAGLPASGKTIHGQGIGQMSTLRRIAVVAFPKPEDLEFRVDKRFKEMGMEVPADATNNMIAEVCILLVL
ncbi:hypothetical protein DKX38_005494 [Salix brachista]|uniref:Uncharacterized protein n=1 Tax=Salix brachista TaxID=2182728 RepID=A0A5N5N000_9ROSI|nr:hypothetical protein DKX38_005494 [Salix brachista]